jgi:hypothetical protein
MQNLERRVAGEKIQNSSGRFCNRPMIGGCRAAFPALEYSNALVPQG